MNVQTDAVRYGVRMLDGEAVELCSECGFDGRRFPPGAVVDALGALKWQWHEALGIDDVVVRRRPAEHTWCAVEYAAHARDVLAGLMFVVGLFLDQDDPRLPDGEAASADVVGDHRCEQFEPATIAHELGENADQLASVLSDLTPQQLRRPGSIGDVDGNVLGIARHAVHDATHHLLDVRRGFATILLQGAPSS